MQISSGKLGATGQAETLASVDTGECSVVCHPDVLWALLSKRFPYFVPQLQEMHIQGLALPGWIWGLPPHHPALRLASLCCLWAAENTPRVEELLGYFRKLLETILVSRSSCRRCYPQQGPRPHGKMRFTTTRLSPGHCCLPEAGASKCCWRASWGRGKKRVEKTAWKSPLEKFMASDPILSWQIDGEKWEQWQILCSWAPKSLWPMTAAMKLRLLLFARTLWHMQCALTCFHPSGSCDPVHCGLPGSSVQRTVQDTGGEHSHLQGIFQGIHITGRFFPIWATREALDKPRQHIKKQR